jgi:hypothetical protein
VERGLAFRLKGAHFAATENAMFIEAPWRQRLIRTMIRPDAD